ncbi:hypothetical protein L227DRAFT_579534 [Lentinus tigrinus ALCF2SS1-6]|uniref:Phosphatidic acid phosphatase type 2/haloperoxidase domain-containing protein n=2 Tax=Lentinus tigrinus TaxID=5365 RepID=A0A5C2RV44_9APHY|nr:hypothetical protein L227DRAFT_579534 [Lentinus tigrinus ALCF2SS1-6]
MIMLPIFYFFGAPEFGGGSLLMLAIGVYVSSVLKDFCCSPRPFAPPVTRLTIGSHHLEYGFPPTHSTNSVSIALFFYYLLQRFLSHLLTLPHRRFYTPATDYPSVPPEKGLRPIPSVIDLPRMVELEVDGVGVANSARRNGTYGRMKQHGTGCAARQEMSEKGSGARDEVPPAAWGRSRNNGAAIGECLLGVWDVNLTRACWRPTSTRSAGSPFGGYRRSAKQDGSSTL